MPWNGMQGTVVGREAELGAVDGFLDGLAEGPRALVIEGEAGIGKTTIWEEAVRRAGARSLPSLCCRPGEAESKLSFAGLADLLAPVAEGTLPELCEPQRVALEVALLRTSPRGPPPNPRALGTAVRSVLALLADATPLVLFVDDVQWLDRPSARALAFAMRRLGGGPVGIVATARTQPGALADQLELEQIFRDRFDSMRVGPLSLGALHHFLRLHLDYAFPRPTLQRIAQASGGNPLFALELARALIGARAEVHPGEPLPVPDTLAGLVLDRLARLPAAAREPLLAAASLSTPTTDLVTRALGRQASGLAGAEREGVIEVRAGRLRFTHPLVAATVYSSATYDEKQRMHLRLAEIVPDSEERARHLALGTAGPDEKVAASLAWAAARANGRGAPEAAAELAELAARLTPPDRADEAVSRRFLLADYLFRAGDTRAARELLEQLLEELPAGPARARTLELVARVQFVSDSSPAAAASCERALAEAGGDVELEARIHATLALVSYHDFALAGRHARAALDRFDGVDDPDPTVLAQALKAFAEAEFYLGRGLQMDVVERALELERVAPAPHVADRMGAALGAWLKYAGDFTGARAWLEATHRAAVEEGDEGSLPHALSHLPQLELWTGNWSEAESCAREHLELAERTAQPDQRRQALFNLALVQAHRGLVEEATAHAEELRADAEAAGESWSVGNARVVLGFLALSRGKVEEAVQQLGRNFELREELGARSPATTYADYAEALVELGSLDQAEVVTTILQTRSRNVDWPLPLAAAARCRGLLAAARNDLEAADAALDEALAQHDRATVPFDLARTLIALGQVRRRTGQRRAAKEALEHARAIFADLGAPLWVERAEAELHRIPIRRGSGEGLTPTEERVAALAATGRTNKEVANALFMSPKTVQANLSRVYKKLGIHSRAELGARMNRELQDPVAAKT